MGNRTITSHHLLAALCPPCGEDVGSVKPPICASQIRAARALLGWHQPMLAKKSGLSIRSIAAIEAAERTPRPGTLNRIKVALERAGVACVAADHAGGLGVRFKDPKTHPANGE